MKSLFRYSALFLGSILGIFLLLMAADIFPSGWHLNEIGAFLLHLTPGLTVIIAAVIGFYKPRYGLLLFVILTFVYTFYFNTYRNIQEFMLISFPLIMIDMLLFMCSLKQKKK
jgi:hypothetical protein